MTCSCGCGKRTRVSDWWATQDCQQRWAHDTGAVVSMPMWVLAGGSLLGEADYAADAPLTGPDPGWLVGALDSAFGEAS